MAAPIPSILNSTKKALGLAPEYDVFDPELIMHINSVFFTLNQLGVGPEVGYEIESDLETWGAILGVGPGLNVVKSYVYLRVRLLFDPPASSFAQTALKEQAQEYEWRINVYVENNARHSPIITVPVEVLVDGGTAV